jgi:hypothetical protein
MDQLEKQRQNNYDSILQADSKSNDQIGTENDDYTSISQTDKVKLNTVRQNDSEVSTNQNVNNEQETDSLDYAKIPNRQSELNSENYEDLDDLNQIGRQTGRPTLQQISQNVNVINVPQGSSAENYNNQTNNESLLNINNESGSKTPSGDSQTTLNEIENNQNNLSAYDKVTQFNSTQNFNQLNTNTDNQVGNQFGTLPSNELGQFEELPSNVIQAQESATTPRINQNFDSPEFMSAGTKTEQQIDSQDTQNQQRGLNNRVTQQVGAQAQTSTQGTQIGTQATGTQGTQTGTQGAQGSAEFNELNKQFINNLTEEDNQNYSSQTGEQTYITNQNTIGQTDNTNNLNEDSSLDSTLNEPEYEKLNSANGQNNQTLNSNYSNLYPPNVSVQNESAVNQIGSPVGQVNSQNSDFFNNTIDNKTNNFSTTNNVSNSVEQNVNRDSSTIYETLPKASDDSASLLQKNNIGYSGNSYENGNANSQETNYSNVNQTNNKINETNVAGNLQNRKSLPNETRTNVQSSIQNNESNYAGNVENLESQNGNNKNQNTQSFVENSNLNDANDLNSSLTETNQNLNNTQSRRGNLRQTAYSTLEYQNNQSSYSEEPEEITTEISNQTASNNEKLINDKISVSSFKITDDSKNNVEENKTASSEKSNNSSVDALSNQDQFSRLNEQFNLAATKLNTNAGQFSNNTELNNTASPKSLLEEESKIKKVVLESLPQANNFINDTSENQRRSPRITGFDVDNDNEFELEDEENDLLRPIRKRVKYITLGGNIVAALQTSDATDNNESSINDKSLDEKIKNQIIEENKPIEDQVYSSMIREREQLQNKLSDLENNKAYLRKAEENIQNQLVYLIANDQIADAENSSTSSPLNQIIQNFINEDRTTVENFKQETINQAIQTIAGQKEIDEILLRQRIERELRYEFNQMQLDHEQKMKIVYRRMIESMYSDLLNS